MLACLRDESEIFACPPCPMVNTCAGELLLSNGTLIPGPVVVKKGGVIARNSFHFVMYGAFGPPNSGPCAEQGRARLCEGFLSRRKRLQ